VIELDVTRPWEPPEVARPRRWRWLVFALLPVVVLALVGGAERPASLAPLFEINGVGDFFLADGDSVFVALNESDRTVVSAYRARDGRSLWSTSYGTNAQLVGVRDGFLELMAPERNEVFVVDGGSGAVVWRLPGYLPVVSAPDLDVVVVTEAEPASELGRLMIGVDLRTGRERWSSGPNPMFIAFDGGAGTWHPRRVDRDAGGTLHIHDMNSGAEIRSVKLDISATVESSDIVGDVLVVRTVDELVESVFDLESGRRLWQPTAWRYHEGLWPCGTVLCHLVGGAEQAHAVEGLERRSGRRLWVHDGWRGYSDVGERYLLGYPATENGSALLVDVNTGAVVRRLGRWQALTAGGWPGFLVWQTDAATGTTVFGQVDGVAGAVTVFGRLKDSYDPPRCAVAGAVLVCAGVQRLAAWRVPS